jgi:hypothetical protein
MKTLTVNVLHPHTVTGPRYLVVEHYRQHGVALWLRACGTKAVLFYRDGGRTRQRAYSSVQVVRREVAR